MQLSKKWNARVHKLLICILTDGIFCGICLNIKLIEFLRRSFVGLNDLEKGRMLMYNFMLAFVICGIVYFIGEAVSNLTKAWVPSVFVTAAVMLVGYWTIFPTTLVSNSMLIPFGSSRWYLPADHPHGYRYFR